MNLETEMNKVLNTARCDKIMIVDDTTANLQLLNNLLTEHGYTVYPASDGELALEFVRSTLPDLVLMDIRMPGMDGFEVCRRLKSDVRTRSIPIIFISILEDERDKVKGFQAGAVDYITKPFQAEEVLARVKTHLQLRDLTHRLERKVSERTAELVTTNKELLDEIAERRNTEETLRDGKERFNYILDAMPDGCQIIDSDWRYVYLNDAVVRQGHYRREAMIGHTMMEVYPGIENTDMFNTLEKCMENRVPGRMENEFQYPDGTAGWFDLSILPVKEGIFILSKDITERKRAEQDHLAHLSFFESMDKINKAIQGTNDLEQMMCDVLDTVLEIFDSDRAYLSHPLDPEADTLTVSMERCKPGYPGASMLGMRIPVDSGQAEAIRILLDTDGPVKSGPGCPFSIPEAVVAHFNIKSLLSMALHPKLGKPWRFGLHQCDYDRIWTEAETRLFEAIGRRLADGLSSLLSYRDLCKNERFLNNIVDHIPNMIFVKDAQTLKYIRFNKAGERLVGYSQEDLIGKTDYDFFPKEKADFSTAEDRHALDSGALVDIPEEIIRNRKNEERLLHTQKIPILDETGTPQYLLSISEDVTEYKMLEEQLRQAQKMESVGRLAGGVAHDFNNKLLVIFGNTELAIEKAGQDPQLIMHLQEIWKAAEHSADLTKQLLAFARKQTVEPRVIDLDITIEGMLKMIRRLIGEDINLSWRPAGNVWPIKMDPSQIDQILANLCVNARDAIRGVGDITIETGNAMLDNAYCTVHAGFKPGPYAILAVNDNGCGMDRETLDNVFEPFFTTKEFGKGTGLGLATVYGIVKQNDGFINAYSEPGQGTTFKIYLPRHESEVDQAQEGHKAAPVIRGHETILLVEDEPIILEMVNEILNRLGYRVLSGSRPQEAIRTAKEYGDTIHLLITDVIMPEMNGIDLANEIKSLYPEIISLFMSGYPGDTIVNHGVLNEGFHFIQKPFTTQSLSKKIREVLDKE